MEKTLKQLLDYQRFAQNPALQSVIDENAKSAAYLATKTLRKVQKKIGFAPRSLTANA